MLPLLFPLPAFGKIYEQVYGLIDIRSTYSDGDYSIDQLAAMAKERGFGALLMTDHDRMALAYGFPPFRHLLGKKEARSAVHVHGTQAYLQAIRNVQARHPEVILIPGVETTPFYYWTGSPFGNDLTAHDHEKRLLVIGLNQAEDYRNMPILHNRKDLRWDNLQPPVYLFLGAALLSIPLMFWSGPCASWAFWSCPCPSFSCSTATLSGPRHSIPIPAIKAPPRISLSSITSLIAAA
jgi:hypothetical protein